MQKATGVNSDATPETSPVNITNISGPSRRAMLGFAGVGAIALAAPIAAQLPQGNRWETLRQRWEIACEVAADYYERIYKPARQRLEAFTGESPPLHFNITAKNGQTVRHEVHSRTRSPFSVPNWNERHDELADAWDAWMKRSNEAESRHGWQTISAKMDDLDGCEYQTRNAMFNEPAPHAEALALKVQLALGNDELWDCDRAALLADAQRMA